MTIAIIPSSSGSPTQYTTTLSAFLGAGSTVVSFDDTAIVMTGSSAALNLLGVVMADKTGVQMGVAGKISSSQIYVGLGSGLIEATRR